jgi:hypothetical protein
MLPIPRTGDHVLTFSQAVTVAILLQCGLYFLALRNEVVGLLALKHQDPEVLLLLLSSLQVSVLPNIHIASSNFATVLCSAAQKGTNTLSKIFSMELSSILSQRLTV